MYRFIFVIGVLLAQQDRVQSADWPAWRGQNRNAVSPEVGLSKTWSKPPKLSWRAEGLGKGYSSVVVSAGLIVTTGSVGKEVFCSAINSATGKLVWRTKVGETARNVMSTPTLHAGLVYVVDPDGELICLETKTGAVQWERNLVKEFGGRLMSGRGFGESPLIDGDRLICTPGGPDAMVVALNSRTGKTIWQSKIPDIGTKGRDGAAFASISISKAAGVKQYVTLCGRGLIGIEAETGNFLWGYNDISNQTANIPTPIVQGDYVFSANGYHAGSVLLKIERSSETALAAKEVYRLKGNRFQNHHGGFVLIDGHIYGGHGSNNGLPTCLELKTGKIKWKRRGPGSGSASVVAADGHLVFKYQDGVIALIEATPESFNLKGVFELPNTGADGWSHPVISNGKLLLREKDNLWAYDIRESVSSPVNNQPDSLNQELANLAKQGISVKQFSYDDVANQIDNLLRFAVEKTTAKITVVRLTNSHLAADGTIQSESIKLLSQLKSPFVLSLAGTNVKEAGLAQVATLPNVRGLSVELCPTLDDESFKSLALSKGIRVLIATSTNISDAALKDIARLPNLVALDLEVCDSITNDSCTVLGSMKKLRALNLKKTAFEKKRVAATGLQALSKLSDLEVLNLTGNAITNDGLKILAQFGKLRSLSLNLLAINDSGIAHLEPLSELQKIDLLYSEGFAGPKLTDAAIKSLAKNVKLQSLNIVGANVTDASLDFLVKLKNLKSLDVVNTRLSQQAIDRLSKAIPDCKINSTSVAKPNGTPK
jgi:outer membrane protein assembly factor BamB